MTIEEGSSSSSPSSTSSTTPVVSPSTPIATPVVTPIPNPNPNTRPTLPVTATANTNQQRPPFNPNTFPQQSFYAQPYTQPHNFQTQQFYPRPLFPAQGQYPLAPQNFPPTPNFLTPNPYPTLPQPLAVKLSENNFLLWKNQLLNAVLANGLSGYLDGSIPSPQKFLDQNQMQPNPEYLGWERYNRFIMCWIYSSLSEEKMGEIVNLDTAAAIWESLKKSYDSKTTARIMGLKTQLHRIKKDGLTVSQYLAQIKEVTDKFCAIGKPISYRDHLAHILDGLGSEYNAFVTTIQNRSDNPSLEDVRSLLLAYEARLEKQNTVEQLNIAQANLSTLNLQSVNRRSTASYSPRPHFNHFSKSTFTSAPQPQSPVFSSSILGKPQVPPKWPQKSNSSKTQCQICGKIGHTALICHHRTNLAYQTPPPNPQAFLHSAPTNPSSLVSDTSSVIPTDYTHPDESWFLDSGATHHMTHDVSTLCNPTPYHGGEQITIGNGSTIQENPTHGHT